jgi:hypothetical protein
VWDSNLSWFIYNYALSAYSVVSNVFKSFGAMVRSITNLVVDGSDLKLTGSGLFGNLPVLFSDFLFHLGRYHTFDAAAELGGLFNDG